MFDKEAIQELQTAAAITEASVAIEKSISDINNPIPVALPSKYMVQDIEKIVAKYRPLRRRLAGLMETTNEANFVSYCKAQKQDGALVTVNPINMTAIAHLNFGDKDNPGHGDNRAKLEYTQSAPYTELLRIDGAHIEQRKMAEWLEDHCTWVKFLDVDHQEIKLTLAISAIRNLTIDANAQTESVVESLSETRSAFESVRASSKHTLPSYVNFVCQPYLDLPERVFAARLSVQMSDKTPQFKLQVANHELHKQQMAQQAVDQLTKAFAGEIPVYVGNYHITN